MWLCMTMTDGRIGLARESDVISIAAHPDHDFVRVRFVDGSIDEVSILSTHGDIVSALHDMHRRVKADKRKCRACGCTEEDCSQCIEATGLACSWVEADLCSRCQGEIDAGLRIIQEANPRPPMSDAYEQALANKKCPHCGGDIGDRIFDCPKCGMALDQAPAEVRQKTDPVSHEEILYCPTCRAAGNYDGEWCGTCGTDHKPRVELPRKDGGDGCVYKSSDCTACPDSDPREPRIDCNVCGEALPHDRCDPAKAGDGHIKGSYAASFATGEQQDRRRVLYHGQVSACIHGVPMTDQCDACDVTAGIFKTAR